MEYDNIYSDKNEGVVGIMSLDKYEKYLIAHNRSSDYFFSIYDIEDGIYLGSWGSRGRGPNEFLEASRLAIVDSQIIFTDGTKKEIIYVPIEHILNSLLNKKENVIIRREPYPVTANFRPLHIAIINDYKIAIGSFENSRFGVLDAENNIINCSSDYPFNYDEISGIYRGVVYQSMIKSNSRQSRFVISTYQSDIFEIYQKTDAGIDRIYLNPFNHIPKIRPTPGRNSGYNIDRNSSIGGIVNMAVTDDYIYLIYTSKKSAESSYSSHLLDEILCFNWNGEKIRKYILPFPINAITFTVCVNNEYIYGAREYERETIIHKFKMN